MKIEYKKEFEKENPIFPQDCYDIFDNVSYPLVIANEITNCKDLNESLSKLKTKLNKKVSKKELGGRTIDKIDELCKGIQKDSLYETYIDKN